LERVSGKWTPLAIVALAEVETLGFGALRRRLEGVSQKMLTQTLRSLERDGLVSRKETDGAPVRRVQYALTARGRALQPLLAALKVWVETHLKEIEKTNAVFDARA
jgi:DNA-binding HxlR family transcriptional regulator